MNNNCQHFVKVVGVRQVFMPESDIGGLTGERIVFPAVPPGVTARMVARNPSKPEEELWMLCINKDMATDMGSFFTQSGIQQLTYQELVSLGKQFDPNFVPPPITL